MNKQLLSVAAIAALGVAGTVNAGEAGSVYVKAESGYSVSSQQEAYVNDTLARTASEGYRGISTNLGLGYNITDCIRADVTIQYSDLTNRGQKVATSYPQHMDVKSVRGMVNVYYDFENSSNLTPFVTAGIGIDNSMYTIKNAGYRADGATVLQMDAAAAAALTTYVTNTNTMGGDSTTDGTTGTKITKAATDYLRNNIKDNTNISELKDLELTNKTNFAYQGGVGLSYRASDSISFDLSYSMSSVSKHDVVSGDSELDAQYRTITMPDGILDVKTGPKKKQMAAPATVDNPVAANTEFKETLKHTVMAGIRVSF